jgi:hypothetical protein
MALNGVVTSLFTVANDIRANVDNVYNIGTSGKKFNTMYATTFNGTATEALYADLAERYEADDIYLPGTVVVFGGDFEITETDMEEDTRVAGVISTLPAFKMNAEAGDDKTHPYVALKGKVPCRVVGRVRKGDLMVTSTVPGHAMSMGDEANPNAVFARAIEDFDGEQGIINVSVI